MRPPPFSPRTASEALEDPGVGRLPAGAPEQTLLILGASARAWAASAHRAGVGIRAADLFADRDLGLLGEAVAIPTDDYPQAFFTVAQRSPPGPWCYTGALENHPDLIDAIAARRPLAGNGGAAVGRVRDHRHLGGALADAGLRFPATRTGPAGLPTDGTWLSKPFASAGGRGIAPWRGGASSAPSTAGDGGRIWQEQIDGEPVAAAFLLGGGTERLLGTSRQLLGRPDWHAKPYAYCGSLDIAPEHLADRQRAAWERIGIVLERDFGLRGAVGVDAIVTAGGELVVIEINPRPTASMELIERRSGGSLAARHLATFSLPVRGAPRRHSPPAVAGAWAKAILRAGIAVNVDARVDLVLCELVERWSRADRWPALADLPRSGTVVPAGAPLLTVFAVAETPAAALVVLAERTSLVDRSIRAVVN